ncbi:DUF1090 domain-containing protein [Roseateles saccharophilus]|uniref:Uncharacterized protein n=1 Tax=Roseateles saccharophilus TaxID=304 RepID=A0A4R3UM50_ROSSA|nr:hypothetical protein EV671_102558 [Roseateles saccharophilus]
MRFARPLEGGATCGPAKPAPRWPLEGATCWRGGLLIGFSLLVGAAVAQPATRAEVATQRAAIEQRFARETQACEQQFAVASCLEEVRVRRHAALEPLVRREHELAADERRARAAAQALRVRERDVTAAQDEGQRRERIVAAPPPSVPATPASHAPRALGADEAARQQQQAQARAAAGAARRREQLQEREERQRQRVAEHEVREKRKTRPAAALLPLPGASGASAPR